MALLKERTAEESYQRMVNAPIGKLIATLAVPTVISMLVTAIYNMADTFFVSQLGTSASGAVGIVFSVMAIIQAVGFCFGMGASSIISRLLGQKNYDAANMIATSAFLAVVVCGSLILTVGLVFNDQLMRLLGATPTILPYAKAYASYIFLGAPVMGASMVMNNILRAEGKALFSMVALTSGGILNIILDPLFIFDFGLGLGTAGAAIATCLSQCVSFLVFVVFFVRQKSTVKIRLKSISRSFKTYSDIFTTGFPALARQGLASIAGISLNKSAGIYGDAAIAAVSIVQRIIMFAASSMIGVGQGYSPVSGYNYGAKKFGRVREAYWFTVRFGFCLFAGIGAILVIFAPQIITLFRNDIDVIRIGSATLRYQAATLPLHAIIVTTNMLMQSTGKRIPATILSCTRNGIFFIPAILILPQLFGLVGVETAQAVADVSSALFAIPFVIWFMKNISGQN